MKHLVCVIGRAGSGKGTCCKKFINTHSSTLYIEVGEIIRRKLRENSLPEHLQKCIDQGHLIPDEEALKIVQAEIESSPSERILIDGYPRTNEQLKMISKIYPQMYLVDMKCSRDECMNRLLQRKDERNDDNIDSIIQRFEIYDREIDKLMRFNRYIDLQVEGEREEVYDKFSSLLMVLFE